MATGKSKATHVKTNYSVTLETYQFATQVLKEKTKQLKDYSLF